MATGGGLALPEPLVDDEARSWFKRYEVCASANGWNDQKKLLRLPTLLKGRSWAIYDSLQDEETDTYDHLKAAILKRLCPDTEEDRIVARERLSRRVLRKEESIDELARDLEKLLDRASPGLPAEIKDSELRFYLINSLPEQISLQLKLQPKVTYAETIAKARELRLIYDRTKENEQINQVQSKQDDDRLHKLEETIQAMSEQLMALSTHKATSGANRCFTCGKLGHISRNCRTRKQVIECFNCGGRGHIARNCWSQGNAKGGTPTRRAGSAPSL